MSEEATIPQLPNNASPPLTSLIELSNANVSQHTALGNVFSQITGDALININGVITISNNAVNNAKIAANAVTTLKILDNNVTLAKLATGITGNLISYAPSGQPVAIVTGNAGQVLTSNGVGMTPTFQTVSGTGGITSINDSMAAAQTFAANNGITLVDTGATHTFSIDTGTVATLIGTQTLTNKTLGTTTTFSAAPTINDGTTFTFSPNATNAGINVGSFGGEPSSPNNGDLVYDSSASQLKAYIASNWVALGSGSGPAPTSLDDLTDVTLTTRTANQVLVVNSANSSWINSTLTNDNLASGTFSNITGIGTLSQNLILGTNSLQFNNTNTTITQDSTDLQLDVATGGTIQNRINNISQLDISASAINSPVTAKFQEAGTAISPIGLHDAWIPASAMWPSTTNGASSSLIRRELTTNDVDIQYFEFVDGTTNSFTQFTWTIPKEWNAGTITAEFFWTAESGAGNVTWAIGGTAYDNDDPLDAVFGSNVVVQDGFLIANDLHISSQTAPVTINGSPVAGQMVQFRVVRLTATGFDTFTGDAQLLGIRINYTTDSAVSS